MRILVLSSYLSRRYAGAAHASITVLNGLAERQCGRLSAFAFEADDGLVPRSVELILGQAPRPRRFLWRYPSFRAVETLAELLSAARLPPVDVCYTRHTSLGLAFRHLFPDTPIISHTGAMLPDREYAEESGRPRYEAAIEARLINRLERRAYAQPLWTHFVSTSLVARERERHYGLRSGFFTVTPLPVDETRFSADAKYADARQTWNIPDDVPLIACVARLVKLKQIDVLLGAAAQCPSRPWLVIAGEGPESATLRQVAQDSGMAQRVRFTGRVDPVPVLAASDIFALPSRLESFGLAYAEAMMMGLPTVGLSNRWPGALTAAPDVIKDGESGFCVATRAELETVLERLSADVALRSTMGARARERARRSFGFEQYARQLCMAMPESRPPA
jgi:glycosyltransferase involved in cell wall biosynthesis